jgi:hypothetical protein
MSQKRNQMQNSQPVNQITSQSDRPKQPLKPLRAFDDVDTRREIVILLQKLSLEERVAFLYYCCDTIGILGVEPGTGKLLYVTVTNSTGDPNEVYLDFMSLIASYGLDGDKAMIELERRVSVLTKEKEGNVRRIYVPEN